MITTRSMSKMARLAARVREKAVACLCAGMACVAGVAGVAGGVALPTSALAQGGANLRILKLSGAAPLEGGIPIVVDGKLIGAVGVSGVTSAQDAQIGRAGIDNLK